MENSVSVFVTFAQERRQKLLSSQRQWHPHQKQEPYTTTTMEIEEAPTTTETRTPGNNINSNVFVLMKVC